MTQPTLFGDDLPKPDTNVLPSRLRDMHALFGASAGNTCAQCAYLKRQAMGGIWYKCLKTDYSAGVATDWRTRWPACGLFEQRQTDIITESTRG